MARTNTNSEIFKALSQFGMMTDKSTGVNTLNTTLSAAEAAAQTVISLTAKTGAAALDYVRIGYSGVMDIGKIEAVSTAANEMTLVSKTAYAHIALEPVRELSRTILGDLSDDGVAFDVAVDRTRIDAATKRHGYDYNINHSDYKVTVALENLSNENFLASVGINDSYVHGAGSTGDPSVMDWTPDNLDRQEPVHFWARGTLGNGDTVELQWWDCRVDPSKTMTLARGKDAPLQLVFNAAHFRWINPVT